MNEPLIYDNPGAVPRRARLLWALATALLWAGFLYLLVPPARELFERFADWLTHLPLMLEAVKHVLHELFDAPSRLAGGSAALLASGVTLHRAAVGAALLPAPPAGSQAPRAPAFDDAQLVRIRVVQRLIADHDAAGQVIAMTPLPPWPTAVEASLPRSDTTARVVGRLRENRRTIPANISLNGPAAGPVLFHRQQISRFEALFMRPAFAVTPGEYSHADCGGRPFRRNRRQENCLIGPETRFLEFRNRYVPQARQPHVVDAISIERHTLNDTIIAASLPEDKMTTSYKDYLSQIEDLQKKASVARKTETEAAVREVRRLIAEYGLTAREVGLEKAPKKRAQSGEAPSVKRPATARRGAPARKVPPKYIGPNGELWTGRGRRPVWVTAALEQGATLADLRIPAGSVPKELSTA